ncbi:MULTISPECIES: tetratricopeptide repeat protein [unclassified Lebetimonas]|uniref:tetratricopeptide repeat protein n=1 Tax=unclassified Lebetimonas TaxID=2648158 RepID=UPI0004641DF4|nr:MULTISPECIES: tetratricopeptide repeat protein [unclassified Lebetimonas]
MKKLLFLLPLLLFADVNPFNAGNLNSPNPYGLTPDEKAILNNKKSINNVLKNINSLKNELKKIKNEFTQKFVQYDETINDLKDKSQAIKTMLDEIDLLNNNMVNIKKRISNLEANISGMENNITVLNNNYSKLKESINEIVKIQNQNFKYLTSSIQDILNQIKKQNISPKAAYKKAKKLYFSGKLKKAKNLFLISLNSNYMPATSSFYLGEISFKNKNYKDALAFYKKSITLYPKKTSFTDKLLYHTGISFEKLGMKKEALLTFEKLINDFKNSKYLKLAKKELEKLK